MPENINNYLSKFAPKSHFFTQPAAITQTAAQAFGPVSENEFRLTSSFTVAANAPAFAICTGIVFIQPQAGSSNKVNLVLRPYKQPISGINIRYFVYRGLNRADFFDGNKVKAASGTSSGFINKINADFASFHTNTATDGNTPVPDFLAQYIGYDPDKQADTLPLDDFFFKLSADEAAGFELPLISEGQTLGNFVAGECGLEIVLSYGDYKLPEPHNEFVFNLAYARAAETTINVATEADAFKKKVKKEQIYQFLDVAAYFGFHYSEKGSVTVNNAGTKENVKGDAIYTNLVQKFYTKNRLYLYIQSDRNRSYNFYGNYNLATDTTNALKLGTTETILTAQPFTTNGWPLLIIEGTQNHSANQNHLFLQLVTDNKVNAVLYGAVAQIDNAQQNNFINADNLFLPPAANGVAGHLTKMIKLSTPATGPANAKVNVASFNLLLYQGKTYSYEAGLVTDAEGITTPVLAQPNFFDEVFDLINATPLLQAGSDIDYSSLTSQKLKLINQYFNKQQQGTAAVQTLVVNDVLETGIEATPTLNRVSYITEAIEVLNNAVAVTGSVTSDTKSSPAVAGAVTASKTYKLPAPYYYNLKPFTDSTQTIMGLELKTTDGSLPNKIILGLTKAENDLLKGLISTNQLSNPRLFLVDLFEDGNELISAENIIYQKYRVGIVGEQADGKLKLLMPSTDVIAYSLDRLYHFSGEYSRYMPANNLNKSTINRTL